MMPEKVDRPAWEGVIDWPVRDRAPKPREQGWTMVIDKGLGLHAIYTPTDVTVLAAGPSLSFQIENSARLILSADQDLHELTLESSTAQLDLNSHFLRIHSSDLPAAKSDLYSLIRGGQIYDSALQNPQLAILFFPLETPPQNIKVPVPATAEKR